MNLHNSSLTDFLKEIHDDKNSIMIEISLVQKITFSEIVQILENLA